MEAIRELTEQDHIRLARVAREPFYVYSPSPGGGRDWANLIGAGLVSIQDVGDNQETTLLLTVTPAGIATLRARVADREGGE